MDLIKNQIIPNNSDGTPVNEIIEGDTYYSGSTTKLNSSPSQVRLYTLGDTEFRYTFWDKSNELIWKPTIQDRVYYFTEDTGLWNIVELTQANIYDYIQDDYKYMLWSKISGGILKDYFLYPTALEGDYICNAKNYVGVGEAYTAVDYALLQDPCNLDYVKY